MNRWDVALAAGMLVSLFVPMVIVFAGSGKRWQAAQEKARARRLVDHKMNARLLRLNL